MTAVAVTVGVVDLALTVVFGVLLVNSPDTVGRTWILGILIAVGASGMVASAAVWIGRRSRVQAFEVTLGPDGR